MTDFAAFRALSPNTLADILPRAQIMDMGIRPLWQEIPRVAGPAYTVRCAKGDNLMLHAAIHRAPPGAIIVVQAGDLDYAVAGGNVCAIAQKNGITGFVIDGVIRDLAEIREIRFPVFARGLMPKPGGKAILDILNNAPVSCGGVEVNPGDVVVADEEGIALVPLANADAILQKAQEKAAQDAAQSLEEWEANHRARIDEILKSKGF